MWKVVITLAFAGNLQTMELPQTYNKYSVCDMHVAVETTKILNNGILRMGRMEKPTGINGKCKRVR